MTPFALKIVTPYGLAYEGQVEELIVRTTTGDLGILAGHMDCVAPLGMGRATVVADGKKRYADGQKEIIWKMDVSRFRGLTIAVALSQNYLLEVSGDGVNWQTVINYRDISTLNASTGTNDGVTCILVGAYANIESTLYIRLSNANAKTNGSWGGAISSFTFQYLTSDDSEELTIADLKSAN